MRWPAQVAHITRKDLTRYGWLVAALSIGVAVVVLEVLAMRAFATAPSSLLVVLGMFLAVGLFVQEDSPARVDAFWTTRPLHPLAVFTAKLGIVAGLLFIELVGQWVILLAHAATTPAMTSVLGTPALWTAGWLLLAMVVAALTTDLRAYVLGLIGVVAGRWVLDGAITVWQAWRHGPAATQAPAGDVSPWAVALVCLAWAALAAHQYRSRRVRRGWAVAILLLVVSVVLVRIAPREAVADEMRVSGPDTAFTVGVGDVAVDPMLDGGGRVRARFVMDDVPPDHRVTISGLRVQLRGPAGSVLADGAERWNRWVAPADPEPTLEGVDRWLDRDPRTQEAPSPWIVIAELSAEETRSLAVEGAVLRVTGTATLDRLEPVMSVPLASREVATAEGVRLRIAEIHHEGWDIGIEARLSSVGRTNAAARDRFARDPIDRFALVNRATGEALTLRETARSWSYLASGFPSASIVVGAMSLRTDWHTSRPPTAEAEAWLQNAELVLMRRTTVGMRRIQWLDGGIGGGT